MDFLTLHELSVQFDVSVRVLRHRLHQLLLAGKLIEGQDCRREGYVDQTHFVWRINPIPFMRETGYHVVAKPATHSTTVVTQVGNQPQQQGSSTSINVDTKSPPLEREMIDFLKDQVRVKDTQIADLSEQNKSVTSLNLKLNGEVIRQGDQIRDLLRLTGGKMELADIDTKADIHVVTTDTKPATQPAIRREAADVNDARNTD